MGHPTNGGTARQTRQDHRVQRRNGPHGVALHLLASALTILTAIALLGVATFVGDSSVAMMGTEQDERVIPAFYRAVNDTVRSGNPTALDRIVAPNVVFHTPFAQLTPNRSGLEHYLLSIHDTFPAWQLQVGAIVREGDQAVVRVDGDGATPGSFLGLPLAVVPSAWGQLDRLRIVNRQIVEFWSGAPAPVLFAPLTAAQLDLETPPHAIAVDQLSASAGEYRDWGSRFDTRLLYVDQGTLTVNLGPTAPPPMLSTTRDGQVQHTAATPGAQVVMTAGDVMTFSRGAQYRVWHDAADPGVVALTVALSQVRYTGPLQPQQPIAADADVPGPPALEARQADFGATQVPDSLTGVTVSLGRAQLPIGATIPVQAADGDLLLVIEHGSLVLTSADDVRSLDHRNAEGQGLITLGEPFTLHNLGNEDASVLMITVRADQTFVTPAR